MTYAIIWHISSPAVPGRRCNATQRMVQEKLLFLSAHPLTSTPHRSCPSLKFHRNGIGNHKKLTNRRTNIDLSNLICIWTRSSILVLILWIKNLYDENLEIKNTFLIVKDVVAISCIEMIVNFPLQILNAEQNIQDRVPGSMRLSL